VKCIVFLLLLALSAGCASKPASSISLAVVDDVSLTQARDDADAYLGSTVRWGGVVTEVENKADETWVFLVSRALKDNEEPITDGQSEGRFIASFSGFIDPLVYKAGRPLTVVRLYRSAGLQGWPPVNRGRHHRKQHAARHR